MNYWKRVREAFARRPAPGQDYDSYQEEVPNLENAEANDHQNEACPSCTDTDDEAGFDFGIRVASSSDARDIVQLLHLAFREHRQIKPPLRALKITSEQISSDIETKKRTYAVAQRGDDLGDVLIGTIRYRRYKRHLTMSLLAVHPDYRRLGVANALLEWCEGEAAGLHKRELRGNVRTAMTELQGYYSAKGFRVIGHQSRPNHPRYVAVIAKDISG